jgi:3-phenylpropionate/trans-cinnamate dioxygenase ferredoxin reductase subunit
MVNILRVDGAQLDGIHYMRALGNSDSIREDTESSEHVVLIGGSYIGCEVAASLTAKGRKCTIVMMEEAPLANGFGVDVGRYFEGVLTEHGIEIVGGTELEGFAGDGRVEKVLTGDGKEIECDAVVIGAGVRPDTMLAKKAELEVGDGIICDQTLQSSVDGIFAAGDACSYESVVHGRRLRVEHWDVALNQGQHAARSMLGEGKPYEEVPYFFSDLADWASLEYVGPAHEWDEEIWRGDRDSGEFSVWYLHGGKLAAALSVERSDDLDTARRLIASGADISSQKDALADPDSDLDAIGSS